MSRIPFRLAVGGRIWCTVQRLSRAASKLMSALLAAPLHRFFTALHISPARTLRVLPLDTVLQCERTERA